jgi:hypothetical protein
MKEQLWAIARRTGSLFDLINELQWNDEAARTIRTRHLTPLETDSKEMLVAFRDQLNSIERARERINVASSFRLKADQAGKEVYKQHGYIREDMRRADQELELSRKQEGAARIQLPSIQALIKKANEAGNQ